MSKTKSTPKKLTLDEAIAAISAPTARMYDLLRIHADRYSLAFLLGRDDAEDRLRELYQAGEQLESIAHFPDEDRAKFLEDETRKARTPRPPKGLTEHQERLFNAAAKKIIYTHFNDDRGEGVCTDYSGLTADEAVALGIAGTDAWPFFLPERIEESMKAVLPQGQIIPTAEQIEAQKRVREAGRKNVLSDAAGDAALQVRNIATSNGGKATAQNKRDELDARNDRIKTKANELLKNGRSEHELASLIAPQFDLSKRQIKTILNSSRPKKTEVQ
jgi:hypothetical protein